jgi:AGZA family xanthine/uracil permease-like MFS transporter
VFVIERDFMKASAFALAGAVMTYFGFMHGEAVGIGGGSASRRAWRWLTR